MRILNRIVCWTEDGLEYEGDQRHVEICMRELGLEKESRELVTPCDKTCGRLEEDEEYLDAKGSTKYRGLTARLNYLGQDRTDIQYAVKELSKCMANPSIGAMKKLKKVARYLKGAPRYVLRYAYQESRKD